MITMISSIIIYIYIYIHIHVYIYIYIVIEESARKRLGNAQSDSAAVNGTLREWCYYYYGNNDIDNNNSMSNNDNTYNYVCHYH